MLHRWSSVLLLLAGLTAAAGCSPNAATLVSRGDEAFAAKKYSEARIQYANAVEKAPRLGAVWMKLADTNGELEAFPFPNAYRAARRAADLLPDDMAVQFRAGRWMWLSGHFDEALTLAKKVLDKNPRDVEAQILKANALAELKDLGAAIKELEQAVALDPKRSLTYANLGAVLAREGRVQDAEAGFRKAVEMDANSVAAHLALANFLWTVNRPTEAEASLLQVLQIDGRNVLAHKALATLYVGSNPNRAAEAEPHLKAAADASKDVGLIIVLADYYLSQHRPDDAQAVLRTVAKGAAGYGAAQTRLAAIDFDAGRKADAHKTMDAVLATTPNDAMALAAKGRFLLGDGKRDEALVKVRASVAADPRYAPAWYLLGVLSLPADPGGAIKAFNETVKYAPRAIPAYMELARLYLAEGKKTEAVARAAEAVRYDPDNLDARELFARALLLNEELDRAAQEVQYLQSKAPQRAVGPVLAALVALSRGDIPGAKKLFEKALAADPSSFEALSGLVQLDLAYGKPADARKRVDAALARDSMNSRAYLLAANVASAEGDTAAAERSLRQAANADPTAIEAYTGLGRLYAAQNKLPEAQREFEAVAVKQPKSVMAHTFVAMAMQVQGREAEAQKRYEQILAMDPQNPQAAIAANNLAMIYAERGGNLDAALRFAQTALQFMQTAPQSDRRDRPEIYDTLGWIYYKKGLNAMAVTPLLQAANKAPKNAIIQYHAGMALQRAGDTQQARKKLEAALALNPAFAGADEARRTLASVK